MRGVLKHERSTEAEGEVVQEGKEIMLPEKPPSQSLQCGLRCMAPSIQQSVRLSAVCPEAGAAAAAAQPIALTNAAAAVLPGPLLPAATGAAAPAVAVVVAPFMPLYRLGPDSKW